MNVYIHCSVVYVYVYVCTHSFVNIIADLSSRPLQYRSVTKSIPIHIQVHYINAHPHGVYIRIHSM